MQGNIWAGLRDTMVFFPIRHLLVILLFIIPGMSIARSSCPKTKVSDKTTLEWTETDDENLEFASKRCVVHYPDAPCLKEFIKVSFQNYHAICGVPGNSDRRYRLVIEGQNE